jgi:putative zinc finger/helix-turn-helix YgiT family protein
MKIKKCPFCKKGELARKDILQTFNYKGNKIKLPQPGEYCNKCREGIISGADIKLNEKQIHDWQAKIDNFLSSDEVRKIRKKLNLTQKEAAEIVLTHLVDMKVSKHCKLKLQIICLDYLTVIRICWRRFGEKESYLTCLD